MGDGCSFQSLIFQGVMFNEGVQKKKKYAVMARFLFMFFFFFFGGGVRVKAGNVNWISCMETPKRKLTRKLKKIMQPSIRVPVLWKRPYGNNLRFNLMVRGSADRKLDAPVKTFFWCYSRYSQHLRLRAEKKPLRDVELTPFRNQLAIFWKVPVCMNSTNYSS